MAAFGFDLPNINGNTLKDEKERKQIMDYLFQLTEQLKYTLSHLDQDNMTESFREEIQSTEAIKSFERMLESADGRLQAVLKQTAEGFKFYVKKDDVISSINQSGEMIAIDASKLKLEGYVTINGSFTVDEEGYLRCTGGTLGAFTVDGNGAIMGNGRMMIGSMTLDGKTISGMTSAPNLKIEPKNIQEGKWAELGQGSQVLGVDGNYGFAFGVPYVTINGTDYYVNFTTGGYTPPTSTTVDAVRLTGDRVYKRTGPGTNYPEIGYCYAGEIYRGSVSGGWAYCTAQLTYSSSAGGYVSVPLEQSFYCAAQYVEQTTVQLA